MALLPRPTKNPPARARLSKTRDLCCRLFVILSCITLSFYLAIPLLVATSALAQAPVIELLPDSRIFGESESTYLSVRALADLNDDGAADAVIDYSVRALGVEQSQQDVLLGRAEWPELEMRDDLENAESLGIPYVRDDMNSRDNAPFYGFRDIFDVNGDDIPDLASFEHQRRMSEVRSEEVKIYEGGADWRTPNIVSSPPQVKILQQRAPQDAYEAKLNPMPEQLLGGDFNGDGHHDLAIASCHVERGREFDEGQTGTLRIYFAGENGLASISLRGNGGDVRLTGETGLTMGCFEAFAGDFDGDGTDDLLVSGSDLTEFGGSYAALMLGRSEWPGEAQIEDLADTRFVHEVEAGGVRALDARDLDGDGDVEAVFEYGESFRIQGACAWLGGSEPPEVARAADCPLVFSDETYYATGDLDGDDILDLIFELPYRAGDEGPFRYSVLRGPVGPGTVAIGEKPGSNLGDTVLELDSELRQPEWFVADIDGDRFDDLVLSRDAATNPEGDEFAGLVEIFLGPIMEALPPTDTPTPSATATQNAPPTVTPTPDGPQPTAITPTPDGTPSGPIYLPLGLHGHDIGSG